MLIDRGADMTAQNKYGETPSRLSTTGPTFSNACESLLTREYGKCGRTRAIQEDLSETKLDPVPEKEALDESEREHKRQDAKREEVRDARAHGAPL